MVAGIDIGTANLGIVTIGPGEVVGADHYKPQGVGAERLVHVVHYFEQLVEMGVELACVEGYSFGSKNQAHQMGEVGGIIRVVLTTNEVPFVIVPPALVKKFAADSGNAKKDQMRLAVYKRWGVEFSTEHETDGFVLAKIAQALHNPGSHEADGLTQKQKEVLKCLRPSP